MFSPARLSSKAPVVRCYHCCVQMAPCIIWSGVLERIYGVEYWSGVESNFGVAKILFFTPADSIYLTFSNIWTGHFLTDIRLGHCFQTSTSYI